MGLCLEWFPMYIWHHSQALVGHVAYKHVPLFIEFPNKNLRYPLVIWRSYWQWPIYSWFIDEQWGFSIVIVVYQRVGRPGRPYHKHKFFKIFIHTHINGKVTTPDFSNPQGCVKKRGVLFWSSHGSLFWDELPNESPAGFATHYQIPLGLVLDGASHVVAISHDGSMVLVYMLTWLGYIDGIPVTIYSIHGSYGYRRIMIVGRTVLTFSKPNYKCLYNLFITEVMQKHPLTPQYFSKSKRTFSYKWIYLEIYIYIWIYIYIMYIYILCIYTWNPNDPCFDGFDP